MKTQNPFHPHILLDILRVPRRQGHILVKSRECGNLRFPQHSAANPCTLGSSRALACKLGVERPKSHSTPIFY